MVKRKVWLVGIILLTFLWLGACVSEKVRLHRALSSPDPIVRATACRRLGELKDRNSVVPLTKLLSDSVALVRFNAALALGEIGDVDAVDPLWQAVRKESIPDVAMAMTKALSDLGPPAVPRLIELLNSPLSVVRLTACQGLGKIQASQAIGALILRLDDPDRLVRRAAMLALRRIGDPRGLEAIARKLTSSDRDAALAAEDALSGPGYEEQLEKARQILRSFLR